MKIELTKFLRSVSIALDYVEGELLKVTPYHSQRVAVLANTVARELRMDTGTVYALTQAAILHDCALSEYLDDEFLDGKPKADEHDMSAHCIAGEEIVSKLPFYGRIHNAVLYHHETADGTGPFSRTDTQVPVSAQLIHLGDAVDTRFDLSRMDEEKYRAVRQYVADEAGRNFSKACADAFLRSVDYPLLVSVTKDGCVSVLERLIPDVSVDVDVGSLRRMSSVFADITDYKSHFTQRHSLGIAEKAEAMGKFYGYDRELCDRLYIAGALHDIGKLFISNDILEKNGKLTAGEYKEIQNHALGTWRLLDGIAGLEDITSWAANHHEKLDGSGYPYGKKADELGRNERLMACLDIYQALVEERPYKAGLSHEEAMGILQKMGDAGQLDAGIISDIDSCFGTGAEPASAAEKAEDRAEYTGEVWKCPVCGYIYEGHLPDDFICPRCEQPGTIFERIS